MFYPLEFSFFFWIGNEKKIIKKKIANLSTLRMYYGAKIKNQNYNDQVKDKQEKCDRATLQVRRVCKKKDLISTKDQSYLSKHLAFLSLQIHHIKQCGTSLQKSILWCRPNLPCQDKQLKYLMWHDSIKSKHTKLQRARLKSYGAMKQKMIHRLTTPLTHVIPIKTNNTPFTKVINCKNHT